MTSPSNEGLASLRHAVASEFERRYDRPPERIVRAPGRVNLIGEHTDYNEGFVLPVAVDREVRVLGQRRPDDRVIVYSATFRRRTSFELDALGFSERQTWVNYPQGVADVLQRAGHHLVGMNLLLWGNVPLG